MAPLAGVLAVVLGALLAGCAEGPSDEELARDRLRGVVLTPLDAPVGTAYVEGVSGYQDLEVFARDAAELEALREDGFLVGHLALFLPSERQGDLTPEDPIAQGIAGVFATPDGAAAALRRFADDVRERQLPGAADVAPPPGLGADAVALRGEGRTGVEALVVAWRHDTVVLAVTGQGPVVGAPLDALVAWIASRAAA